MRTARTLPFLALLAALALADGTNERTGVNNKDGNPSPPAGSSQPGGISNIDDYTQQDEQINIDASENNVVKVLRVNQKNLVNDYVVAVFPIQNAAVQELSNLFREVAAAEGGRAEIIRDTLKKQYFLWVAVPKFLLPHIQTALRELDVPWINDDIDGSKQVYYRAKFRDAANIHELLKYPGAAELRGLGADNNVDLDTVNNAALYVGEPYRGDNYVKYAAEVDQPVPQLLCDVAIYEVEVTKESRIGLDYIAWKNGPGRNLFEYIAWGSDNKQVAWNRTSVFDPFPPAARTAVPADLDGGVLRQTVASADASGYYYNANYLVTSAFVNFLAGSGRARLITRGKLTVKNGQVGTLSAADQELHFRVNPSEANTPTDGIVPTYPFPANDIPVHHRAVTKDGRVQVETKTSTGSTVYLPIGYTLSVRPYIAQKTTELAVALQVNQIVGQTPSGTPQVRSHTLTTTVLCADGQPLCLAGLKRTEDVKTAAKMPLLGSIPILGYAFGHEATVKRETEMVVVLTPTIRFGTEADLEMANDADRLVRQQVLQQAKLPLPRTQVGFDQWLLDQAK
jgi:type II secretory pathway component GspD/PulD (secretin)